MLMRRLLESTSGWGLVARRTNLVIRGLGFPVSLPCPHLWGSQKGWRSSSLANGQRHNSQPCLCNDASRKTQKDEVQRDSGLETMWRWGEGE